MTDGVNPNLSNDEYHASKAVNKSLLDIVARSPLHARAHLDKANDNERPESKAKRVGTALHALLLEPDLFANEYVCELRREDAPGAIDDHAELVAMVQELNADRLPKLPVGGTKPEQIARILAAYDEQNASSRLTRETLEAMKGADLKLELENLNSERAGLLPVSGSRHDLADTLRKNGKPVTLWADVRARWDAENEGYTVIQEGEYDRLLAMAEAVRAHPYASWLFDRDMPALHEASIFWTDAETGEQCRCRPDRWRADGIFVDLKTTEDASPEAFGKSVQKWRYHVQAPWYLDGGKIAHDAGHFPDGFAEPRAFIFVVVEKEFPHAVACYMLDSDSNELGRSEYRADLNKLAECNRSGKWPSFGDHLQPVSLPAWYLARLASRQTA